LSATLGDEATVVGGDAGLHVVVWLKRVPRAQEDVLIARARAAGLGVYPVSPLYARATAADLPATVGLVMGYASLDERAIERGVQTLKEVLASFPAKRPARSHS
jgi:GntR family transcriptional regulator/MocR family aminotransferase